MPITIRSSRKPAKATGNSRTTSTRTRTTRSAAKPSTARTRKPAAKQTAAKTNGEVETRMTPPEGMTARELATYVKNAEKLAARRDSMREEMDEVVKEVHTLAMEMLVEGISMAIVSKTLGMSRQWLYKLIEDNDLNTNARDNGGRAKSKRASRSKPAAKPTARKSTARKSAAKKTTTRARRGSSKPASKATASRGRLSIRSR